MALIGRALAPFAIFLALASSVSAQNYNGMSTDQLKGILPEAHPSAYYILASKLYDAGDADEAVFWFYAGQLRYRTHLTCKDNGTGDTDAALFGALSEVIGSEINRYAFGNLEHLTTTIDDVIAWDTKTPNLFTEMKACDDAHDEIVGGLGEFKRYITENADEVRGARVANGLANY